MSAPTWHCSRCGELGDRCACPTFMGEPHMECTTCGALQGQHLVDLARLTGRLICPPATGEPEVSLDFADDTATEVPSLEASEDAATWTVAEPSETPW